jgi:hypothetical protein
MRNRVLDALKRLHSAVEAVALNNDGPDLGKMDLVWEQLQGLVELTETVPERYRDVYRRLVEALMRETQLGLECLALQKSAYEAGDMEHWGFYAEMALNSALASRNIQGRLVAVAIMTERLWEKRKELAA